MLHRDSPDWKLFLNTQFFFGFLAAGGTSAPACKAALVVEGGERGLRKAGLSRRSSRAGWRGTEQEGAEEKPGGLEQSPQDSTTTWV